VHLILKPSRLGGVFFALEYGSPSITTMDAAESLVRDAWLRRVVLVRARLVRAPPLTDLLLVDLPQVIDIRSLTCDSSLDDLNPPSNTRPLGQRIRCGHGFDFDNANARVILTSIVDTVALVSDPGLQSGGVVS